MENYFGRNLRAFIENTDGVTQENLAEKIGVTLTTVSGWINRNIQPRTNKINEIMNAYNLSQQDLIGVSDGYYAKAYGLTKAPKGAIKPQVSEYAALPLLGFIHAGTPDEADPIHELIQLPKAIADTHKDAFFLEVVGDCMDKIYPRGCFILIDPNTYPQNGSIAAVRFDDGESVVRHYYKGADTLVLSPDSFNPEYTDIVITRDSGRDYTVVGVVVWFQAKEEMR